MNKEELRKTLRAKIEEKRISRSGKKQKEKILEKTMQEMDLNYAELKEDLEKIKKKGGLYLTLKK